MRSARNASQSSTSCMLRSATLLWERWCPVGGGSDSDFTSLQAGDRDLNMSNGIAAHHLCLTCLKISLARTSVTTTPTRVIQRCVAECLAECFSQHTQILPDASVNAPACTDTAAFVIGFLMRNTSVTLACVHILQLVSS